MAGILLSGIAKAYGDTAVLYSIDLDILDGEFLTLVGPSGCGKSTLLRIIAGLETPSAGDVLIGGRSMTTTAPSQRNLAMVFQSYALYPHLSVRRNMETPLRLRDLNSLQRAPIFGRFAPGAAAGNRRIDAQVQAAAQTLQIEHLLDRKPGQLSGGQRQRVALGRAMVRQPAAFLMDEPLSNLDAALRVHMRVELAALHKTLSTTFVYVTHDQAEALTMSTRMAVMISGEILQVGAPSQVYSDPQDRRVAEFVGSPKINMLPGDVDSAGRLTALGTPLYRAVRAASSKAHLGLRPEHLKLTLEANHVDGGEAWPAVITHKENLGSEFFLHGVLNGTGHPFVARATPAEASELSIGAETFLKASPGAAMVFGDDNRRIAFQAD